MKYLKSRAKKGITFTTTCNHETGHARSVVTNVAACTICPHFKVRQDLDPDGDVYMCGHPEHSLGLPGYATGYKYLDQEDLRQGKPSWCPLDKI